IGVRSGHRWWKSEANFESNKQVYAPIGKLGKVSYENPDGTRDDGGVQVADIIGGDSDRDGIPDSMDNCKFTYNPYQEDDDGDGLGDACDNCRQTVCDAIGDGRSCQNPDQEDWDDDGVGDVCDVCPEDPSDLDREPTGPVGERCGCPGRTDLEYETCSHDIDCFDLRAGKCLAGRCTRLTDSDGD